MVLGAVSCPVKKTREISVRLREIRQRHGIPPTVEIKFTGVSPAKVDFYRDIVDYFFDDDDLQFRVVVAAKANLDHERYGQSHDDWYYKQMYLLLSRMFRPDCTYQIYLDMKDTRGGMRAKKLHEVLSNGQYDFDHRIIQRVQIVQSHDVIQMQLADLLLGAVGYANRPNPRSRAKLDLVERIRQRSGRQRLDRSTLPSESKFNIFHWTGQ